MDPMTAMTVLSVGASLAKGASNYSTAMSESAQQDLNAKLAETKALQRDTLAREDLIRSESAVRAARGANNLSGISPNASVLFQERRRASDRDRLISRADDRQQAENFRAAARSSRRRAKYSLITGFADAAIPLAQFRAG